MYRHNRRQNSRQQHPTTGGGDRVAFTCACGNRWTTPKTCPVFQLPCRRCQSTGYRVGIATYDCGDCGNRFVGVGRLDVNSRCYKCSSMASASEMRPFEDGIKRRTTNTHSCELCEGNGRRRCPIFEGPA